MATIHFKSKEWWLDILRDDAESIRLDGVVDFSMRTNLEAQVYLYYDFKPIVDKLLNSASLDRSDDGDIEKLKNSLELQQIKGVFTLNSQVDFLEINLFIQKNLWQKIYNKIVAPPPQCILSITVPGATLHTEYFDKFNPIIDTSLNLKYS